MCQLLVAALVGLLDAFYAFHFRNILVTFPVAAYVLVATILFIVEAALTSGTLGKFADSGLLALSIIDCTLIYATRGFPTRFFGGRILSWSMNWFLRRGAGLCLESCLLFSRSILGSKQRYLAC